MVSVRSRVLSRITKQPGAADEGLVGFEPVVADTTFGDERNREADDVLHFGDDNFAHAFDFRLRDVEVQFVVHLHRHLRFEIFLLQPAVDGDHRHFDDVCGGTLYGGVDGVSLGK